MRQARYNAMIIHSIQHALRQVTHRAKQLALAGCCLAIGLGSSVTDSIARDTEKMFTTMIVVTTASDSNPDSVTRTCGFAGGIYNFDENEPCSLRRAMVEASARPTGDRPILIRFDIPKTEEEHFNTELGTWTISLGARLTLSRENTLETLGQVTIDAGERPIPDDEIPPPDDMSPLEEMRGGPAIILETNDWPIAIESSHNTWRNFSIKGGGIFQLKEDAAESLVPLQD